ncbi:MAG: purine-nucleoside phosphorylase, partial [Oscillospiraceae bacterium]
MSTPHIKAEMGEIAESILLPGDPLRAKYIAENFFESPVLFNDVRGILGYTGCYKGNRISVMGTGMGMPSISIYITELMKFYGVKNLIRIGTCGSLKAEIGLKDIILGIGCCTDNGYIRHTFPGDYAPIADFQLLNTAYEKSLELGKKVYVGLLKSSDMFYFEPTTYGIDKWTEYGVIGAEMEGAALYTLAAKYKCHALTICSVSDGMFEKTELTSDEREKSLNDMITIALDT